MQLYAISLALHIIYRVVRSNCVQYQPNWESLDSRPLPQWYDDAKVGIFIHWGVYSVPAFGAAEQTSSDWFWYYWKNNSAGHLQYVKDNYPPGISYPEFAGQFKAEFYDPNAWAELFEKSGAKYVVITSKHHDGYALWPSSYSFNWNAQDVGPKRDLIGGLAEAIRAKTNLKFGLSYSLYEWFNPLYISDKESGYLNNIFVFAKIYPEIVELVQKYNPDIIWADGEWDAEGEYWKAPNFLAWLYNESPVKDGVVVNDKWGKDISCKHGDFYTCADTFNPGENKSHKWESVITIDKNSWSYRRVADIDEYVTPSELIETMVKTVSNGGNLLINVGPDKDGRIPPIYQERLLKVGRWLSMNGEAIYSSSPWKYQKDSLSVTWYTSKLSVVYAVASEWPSENILELKHVTDLFHNDTVVMFLGRSKPLQWRTVNGTTYIKFPDRATVYHNYAWVVKIESEQNNEDFLNTTQTTKKGQEVNII